MKDIDFEAVARLIREVGRSELLPRFGALASGDVRSKASAEDPLDIVTEADEAAERVLERELVALLPGSIAIGEEATSRDPATRDALEHAPLAWIIDPLDGTKNFAAGRTTFGTMVALVVRGDAVAAWIHRPVIDETLAAELGAGAFLDGTRVEASARVATGGRLVGTAYTDFMPRDVGAIVEANAGAPGIERVAGAMSAACEYPALVRGEKDFNVYWRLLPWDHAPGALILTEAGGAQRHADGRPYRAADRDPLALAVHDAATWDRARDALLAGVAR